MSKDNNETYQIFDYQSALSRLQKGGVVEAHLPGGDLVYMILDNGFVYAEDWEKNAKDCYSYKYSANQLKKAFDKLMGDGAEFFGSPDGFILKPVESPVKLYGGRAKKRELLSLVKLNHDYEKTNTGKYREVYRDPINNNVLVFHAFEAGSGEAEGRERITTGDICNATVPEEAYDYLVNRLNNEHNLLVEWRKVVGLTSDYIIIEDADFSQFNASNRNSILSYIRAREKELTGNEDDFGYKYTTIKGKIKSRAF